MIWVDLRLSTANRLGRGLNFRNRTHYLWATGRLELAEGNVSTAGCRPSSGPS